MCTHNIRFPGKLSENIYLDTPLIKRYVSHKIFTIKYDSFKRESIFSYSPIVPKDTYISSTSH